MIKCQDEIEKTNEIMEALDLVFKSKGGGLPRGTIHTLLDGVERRMSFKKRATGTPRPAKVIPPPIYKTFVSSSLGLMHWILPAYTLGRFTGPNFMSAVNVPVLYWSSHKSSKYKHPFQIRDRSAVGPAKSVFSGYGLIPTLIYEVVLFTAGFMLLLPPVRWLIRRFLKTYSYDGSPKGVVTLRAHGTSEVKGEGADFTMTLPGDPGIYATGLLAAAVAFALLDSTTLHAGSVPSGFVPPVAALNSSGCLDYRFKKFGVEVSVKSLKSKSS